MNMKIMEVRLKNAGYDSMWVYISTRGNTVLRTPRFIFKRKLKLHETIFGPMHKPTLEVVYELGLLYVNQDRWVDAEATFRRALDSFEKALGSRHKSTLFITRKLGWVYESLDRLPDSEAMWR